LSVIVISLVLDWT